METRLRDGLGPVRERFALTLLDCPPSLGPVTVNALAAADRVVVPVQAEYLALEGLVQFLETLELVRRELNPALVLTGVVITMHDERTRLANDVEAELRTHFPELVFDTVIPRSVRVAEAPSFGLPVTDHAPDSRGSLAYQDLARELALARGGGTRSRRAADEPVGPSHGGGVGVSAAKRGMGRGLAAILPQPGEVAEPALRQVPTKLDPAEPEQPRRRFDAESISALAESLRERRRDPAADRPPADRRALRDHRRRAPLARRDRGGPRDRSGAPARRGRGRAHADGADRERRPRAAQPGGRGARLRHARRGPRR